MSTLPQPQPQPDPDQAFALPAWLGLSRRWSQVQNDTQELQREGCLVRTMEIQSHGVCKKDKQIGRYLKGISATAYALKPAVNLTEHPERRHVPGGTGDCLAGRPEQWGWDMGRVEGRRASQHAFCSPEAAGTLGCSQMPRETAATTRNQAGIAPEQAPWLQAQQAGEAPEGGIPHCSVSSTQCRVLGAASACSLVSNHPVLFAGLPYTWLTACPSCTPPWGSQVQCHNPCNQQVQSWSRGAMQALL